MLQSIISKIVVPKNLSAIGLKLDRGRNMDCEASVDKTPMFKNCMINEKSERKVLRFCFV